MKSIHGHYHAAVRSQRSLRALCLALSFLGLQSFALSEAGKDAAMTLTRDGHVHASATSASATSVMRRDTRAAASVGRHSRHRTEPEGSNATVEDVNANQTEINYELFHDLDAGGICAEIPLIQYPTRLEKATMKCLDDDTAHILGITCTKADPANGENHVMYAYPGVVRPEDHTKRYAKVFVPVDRMTMPGLGYPVMVLFHATLPIGASADPANPQADDAKAPEAHFDGLLKTPAFETYMNRMIVVTPAGFERYRFDAPPCKAEKYAAEFNYLQGSLGHTRHSNADDVRFLSMIFDWLHRSQIADLSKIYISGHASGGNMALYLTTQYLYGTDHDGLEFTVSGASASAAGFLTCLNDPRIARGANGDWAALAPMPFMYFQGLQDVASWCAGGGMYRHQGEHMYSTEQMGNAFAQRNKCRQNADGSYEVKSKVILPADDPDLTQTATMWEFQSCDAPVIIYTFNSLSHTLQPVNTFMFKQKMKFFLGDWTAPTGGKTKMLSTQNGTTVCGCCSESTGQCDYNTGCNGKNYLRTVSCPGVADLKTTCWRSTDLDDNPICWWVTSEDASGNR